MSHESIYRSANRLPEPLTITPEPWTRDAACGETDPNAFFPEGKGGSAAAAKAICNGCPVRAACQDYAIRAGETDGIWGGLSPRQLRRRRTA